MAEKAPQSSPFSETLNNFERNKAKHDKAVAEQKAQEWLDELQGEAGKTDFSDDARKRLKELDIYHQHMEHLAGETRPDYDRGLDRLESGETESHAYNQEWDEAIAENEAYDTKREAQEKAEEAKFAADPRLRQMDRLAREISELRTKSVTPEAADRDVQRFDELNDRLQELLLRYSESDDYDPAIADIIIDRSDTVQNPEVPADSTEESEEQQPDNAESPVGGSEQEPEKDEFEEFLERESGNEPATTEPLEAPDEAWSTGEEKVRKEHWTKRLYNRFQERLVKMRSGKERDGLSERKNKVKAVLAATAVFATALFPAPIAQNEEAPDKTKPVASMNNENDFVGPRIESESKGSVGDYNPDKSETLITIFNGEGWEQVMTDMGINKNKQDEILKNDTVMQRLADIGVAYRAPELGGWGVNMPENGELSQGAKDILQEAAK